MAKSKYETNVLPYLTLIECWARDGLTDIDIAKRLKINVATLYRYKNEHSEICESLKKGKEIVDYDVENALLKRALGYDYTETTSENKGGEMVITKKVVKHIVPDVTAQIFWLKNRKPDQWKDKPEGGKAVDNSLMESLLDAIRGVDDAKD